MGGGGAARYRARDLIQGQECVYPETQWCKKKIIGSGREEKSDVSESHVCF